MGLGVILFFGLCLGSFSAMGLAALGWDAAGRSGARAGLWRRLSMALVPFALFVYGVGGFAGYAIWCESVRHVDLGTGDAAYVPIGHGYSFCILDSTIFIGEEDCGGPVTIEHVRRLAESGERIVGVTASREAFVLDTRSRTLQTVPDIAVAMQQFASPPKLQSAGDFYWAKRWGWSDLGAFALVGIPGLAVFGLWFRSVIRLFGGLGRPEATSAHG